jgi:chromosome partitioning protein
MANAIMYASRKVLAPVWLDGQAIAAIEVLNNNISELNNVFSAQNLNIQTHLVANGYHGGYQTCKDSLAKITENFGNLLDDNIIPHAAGFMRQLSLYEPLDSGPILEREPKSVGARAIIDLTKSLIRLYGITLPQNDNKETA